MAQSQEAQIILNQLNEPAFLVENGIVTATNEGAAKCMISTGMEVCSIIGSGIDEYKQFQGDGCLYLTLYLGSSVHTCCVTFWEGRQLFIINDQTHNAELQALSLAAGQLSIPLSEITLIMSQLSDMDATQKSKINKNLYRLQRIIGNMSDAAQLIGHKPKKSIRELCSMLYEILEKSRSLLMRNGVQVAYTLPNGPVFAAVNEELVTRAMYNMISNAVKFTPALKSISVTVEHRRDTLYITVQDNGLGIDYGKMGNVFQRYTRQPGLEDPKFGLGIGMSLVHTIAAIHDGTVLVEKLQPSGTKITMTLSTRYEKSTDVKSPVLIPDLYGGQDQALIELSDILPYQMFTDE